MSIGHLYILPMNGTGIVLDSKIFSEENIYKAPPFHLNTNNIEQAFQYMKRKNVEITTKIENSHWFNYIIFPCSSNGFDVRKDIRPFLLKSLLKQTKQLKNI